MINSIEECFGLFILLVAKRENRFVEGKVSVLRFGGEFSIRCFFGVVSCGLRRYFL